MSEQLESQQLMHCNSCGCILHEGEQFCPGCGKPFIAAPPVPASQQVPPPMYVAAGHPSGKATASLICGIFFFVFPAAVLAIVFGHLALSEIKKSAGRLIGEGRAIAGLVLGYLGIAFIPLTLIIAAIAIPNLLRARITANEASAVGSLRTINTAESTYVSEHAANGFTCELNSLGLRDHALATGTKNGYSFSIENCSGDGTQNEHYQVLAIPMKRGQSGQRSFCSDETGVIKASKTERTVEGCLSEGEPLE